MRHPFIDFDALEKFLTDACDQYEKTAPTVHEYCDNLYQRLARPLDITMHELFIVARLKTEDGWLHPNYAANLIYHLMHETGQTGLTVGHAGF